MVHPHGLFNYEPGSGWRKNNWWLAPVIGAGILAGAIGLALTIDNDSAEEATVANKPVTFDDLGVGSNVIKVYPGVTRTQDDMIENGTYFDGQTVTADCRIDGRTVPQPGDNVEHSVEERSTWVHFQSSGIHSFAVTLYLQGGLAAAQGLAPCEVN